MAHDAQLHIELKRLKFSGIGDTLNMRLLESQQNQLDYRVFWRWSCTMKSKPGKGAKSNGSCGERILATNKHWKVLTSL